ncbi:hypothetical protein emb_1c0381 [Coriobacteriaceae bacterium EMTCatB1]|nr:hypothetical protein emb_1c0381 [Coriobacteriaceae bacterium EMTCatB1]
MRASRERGGCQARVRKTIHPVNENHSWGDGFLLEDASSRRADFVLAWDGIVALPWHLIAGAGATEANG